MAPVCSANADPGSERRPTCAVVLSKAVGDGVLMMSLVAGMARGGYEPVVYGHVATQLAAWFPWCRMASGTAGALPDRFDLVVELYASTAGAALSVGGRSLALAEQPGFRRPGEHMLDSILRTGAACLGLPDTEGPSGIVVPGHLGLRRRAGRVVIHPTASHPEKAWTRAKFVAVARALRDQGFEPSFIVTPAERDAWRTEERHGTPVQAFESLDGVAAWTAEAGWFIGNDSGPGHLAAAIGVPTLSLFMRRGLAQSWRPRGRAGRVVLPPRLLPGAWLRERFWQRTLSVARILREFDALRAEVEAGTDGDETEDAAGRSAPQRPPHAMNARRP